MSFVVTIIFGALSIFFVYDAYKKNPENHALKKFKTGIIIAVVLMGLTIVGTVVSLLLSLSR